LSPYQCRLVRAALIYLVLTGLLGVLFHLFPVMTVYYRTTHIHLGVVGFFLSMVMGVAYWMMPRPGGLRQEGIEAITFYLLNAGLILRFVAEPTWRYSGETWLQPVVLVSGLLQFAAILTFAYAMQARVKTADTIRRLREERQAL
jgi:hypothetical protein